MLSAFYRKLAFLLCLVLLISFVACDGGSEKVSTESELNEINSVTVSESDTDSVDEIESNIGSEYGSYTEGEPGFAGEYQADEQAGVARLRWRVSGR